MFGRRSKSSPTQTPQPPSKTAGGAAGKTTTRDKLSNSGPYLIGGVVVVALMFGGLGTWAAVAPLAGAAIAPGVVKVDSNRKTIQHLEGGVVADIRVQEGSQVSEGDILIRLEGAQARADLSIIRGRVDRLRAEKARLEAERDGEQGLTVPDGLSTRAQDDEQIAGILASQRSLFEDRRATLQGQVSVYTERIQQTEDEIAALEEQRASFARQIQIIQDQLDSLEPLAQAGHVQRTRLLDLERQAESLRGDRSEARAAIARARKEIGEAQLQRIQLRTEFRERASEELRTTMSDLSEARQQLTAARNKVERLDIRAPVGGQVVGLEVHTEGGVVSPGQPVMYIVPKNDTLLIEARVNPSDIDRVSEGQTADVRLTAFNTRTTPVLTGEVLTVSGDAVQPENAEQPYYITRVRIPEDEMAKLAADQTLVPGMPVEVFIKTGERTVIAYLMQPFTDALSRGFRE